MTRLIEVNRSYQSVTSTVGRMDELRRSAIRQLADANV
jgi:flagellar basal body rod protein FlgG